MATSKNKNQKQRRRPQKQQHQKNGDGAWSRLPPEISHHIFLFLPLHQALKASAVCRLWRSSLLPLIRLPRSSTIASEADFNRDLVRSDHFLPLLRPSSRLLVWFCYHRLSQKWLRFPSFAFLPDFFDVRCVLASHRGLLLLESLQNTLLICNVSTQKFAPLPSLLRYGHCHATANLFHLQVDSDGCAYSIFVLLQSCFRFNVLSDEPGENGPIFARFHSRCGFWETLRSEYADTAQLRHASWPYRASYNIIDKFVVIDDCIFMLVTSRFNTHTQVLQYHIRSCTWSLVCDLNMNSVKMVGVGRTIFLIELREASLQFQIYKLQRPDLLLEVPETRIDSGFEAYINTPSWYASSSSSWPPCIYLGCKERARGVLEYNVVTKTWMQLLLPHFMDELQGEDKTAFCVCADGYEVGLDTSVLHEGMLTEESEDESFFP